ncbi:MAG: dinitrogenase iron-molybdenum cofactor biosynthesis protein [Chitinivibrionales bacterium]|nr:dinitrogenase iron-molybdenum cofactor biosynthesis protein [Chitinivibrionales bacterium]
MRIAVTAQGSTLDSAVDPRFGRCKHFVIFDSDTGSHESVDNTQNLQAAQGAGIQSAGTIADARCDVVLTGHCGPKAFTALEAAGIAVYAGVAGTVREAVESFKSGTLEQLKTADVQGHW